MTTTLYATRSDLLSALSLDSQAKLSNDPLRRWNIGIGDGVTDRFVTPFIETTTFAGYVDGVLVTPAPDVSTGTGSALRDEAVFDTAPASSTVVAVTADRDAINADVIDRALLSATETINGYLHALLPVTDAYLLESLRGKSVLLAQMRLRSRRSLDVVDPLELEWKAAVKWLELVAAGKIPITSGTVDTTPDGDEGSFAFGGFGQAFSDPEDETSL